MDYVSTIFNNIVHLYNSMNPATLSGAIDVIVVEQPDGTYLSTPFHVRFGKWAVFNSDGKFIDIEINNELIDGVKMKLGENGVAFFVEEIDGEEEFPEYLATSPIPGATGSAESDAERADRKPSPKKLRKRANQRGGANSKKTSARKRLMDDAPTLNPKQKLPFHSSIFSCRKYRSLPDLSFLAQPEPAANDAAVQREPSGAHKRGHKRKLTSGNIDAATVNDGRSIPHSKSALFRVDAAETAGDHAQQQPRRKLQFGTDSDSEDESAAASKKKEKPPVPHPLANIADGALSDSEIDRDRQRFDAHNDPDWKWGEYPESKPLTKEKNRAKQPLGNEKEKPGGWSWFRWRTRTNEPPPQEEGVYLGDLKNKDPNELEKYFGTSSQTSNLDSGNGMSAGGSPNSPAARSMESLVDESAVTPPDGDKSVSVSPEVVETAVKKDRVIEKELLAGAEVYDVPPPVAEAEDLKQAAAQVAHTVSDSDLLPNARSRSGTSVTSDFSSSADEEVAVYTSPDDGRQVRFKRTLRLNSDQLKSLRLEYGSNDARFSITTKFQARNGVIVISDIDGTITRSDVLGQVLPHIGGTWAHAGVAELFSRIHLNGYRMVYLSSRAIGQSRQTKAYLRSVAQESRMLPEGPVLLNPASILVAFRKEVIERRPEEFKIACLQDLRSLFPVKSPFFAGFGNRETDVISYQAVGVPNHRIFTIEPSSKVQSAHSFSFYTNYEAMTRDNLVDSFFPPLHDPKRASSVNEEELDSSSAFAHPGSSSPFTYWRSEPEIFDSGVEDEELAKYEARRQENQLENTKRNQQSRRFRLFSN
ncbi:LNS2 protein [Aphelenchoides fujianensis]|nr:LNS2 protein [Aphelenchoides fujianensis]